MNAFEKQILNQSYTPFVFKFSFFHLSSCFIAMRNMKGFLVFFFLWVFKNWMYLVINVLVEDIFTYLPCTWSLSPRLPVKGFGVIKQKFVPSCIWLFEHFHCNVSFSLVVSWYHLVLKAALLTSALFGFADLPPRSSLLLCLCVCSFQACIHQVPNVNSSFGKPKRNHQE